MKLSLIWKSLTLISLTYLMVPRLASGALATYNLRNLTNSKGKVTSQQIKWQLRNIRRINPALMGVQEVVKEAGLSALVKQLGNSDYILSECGGSGRQKVGLIYQKSKVEIIDWNESQVTNLSGKCSQGTRPVLGVKVKLKSSGTILSVYVVHLKAGSKPSDHKTRGQQLKLLNRYIRGQQYFHQGSYAILGDFNTTDFYQLPQARKMLEKFTKGLKLYSTTQKIRCTAYWGGKVQDEIFHPSKLDHILLSKRLARTLGHWQAKVAGHCSQNRCRVSSSNKLGPTFEHASDHCPVVLTRVK